jgi:hypothetical protein
LCCVVLVNFVRVLCALVHIHRKRSINQTNGGSNGAANSIPIEASSVLSRSDGSEYSDAAPNPLSPASKLIFDYASNPPQTPMSPDYLPAPSPNPVSPLRSEQISALSQQPHLHPSAEQIALEQQQSSSLPHPHPSSVQERFDAIDRASGHSHNKPAHVIEVEGAAASTTIKTNAEAPWIAEAAKLNEPQALTLEQKLAQANANAATIHKLEAIVAPSLNVDHSPFAAAPQLITSPSLDSDMSGPPTGTAASSPSDSPPVAAADVLPAVAGVLASSGALQNSPNIAITIGSFPAAAAAASSNSSGSPIPTGHQRRVSVEQRRASLADKIDRWGNIRKASPGATEANGLHTPSSSAAGAGASHPPAHPQHSTSNSASSSLHTPHATPPVPRSPVVQTAAAKKRAKQLLLDQERELKWVKMVNSWARTQAKHADGKLKRRIRKGIPDSLRAAVWPRLTGADKLVKDHPDTYESYRNKWSKDQDTIQRDIARTFPNHILFRDDHPELDEAGVGANIAPREKSKSDASKPSSSAGGAAAAGAGAGSSVVPASGDRNEGRYADREDFEGRGSTGRSALYHVLKAYSLHDEQVGCQ